MAPSSDAHGYLAQCEVVFLLPTGTLSLRPICSSEPSDRAIAELGQSCCITQLGKQFPPTRCLSYAPPPAHSRVVGRHVRAARPAVRRARGHRGAPLGTAARAALLGAVAAAAPARGAPARAPGRALGDLEGVYSQGVSKRFQELFPVYFSALKLVWRYRAFALRRAVGILLKRLHCLDSGAPTHSGRA